MRKMFDAVTATNCPNDGDLYGGYIDGNWPNAAEMARLHPTKRIVTITIWGGPADVIDIENGDADEPQAIRWTVARRLLGKDPTAYCSVERWQRRVVPSFAAARVALPHWWAAGYHVPPTPYMAPGAVATQWTDTGAYDESLVADFWPGVDPVHLLTVPILSPPVATESRSPLLWP